MKKWKPPAYETQIYPLPLKNSFPMNIVEHKLIKLLNYVK